MLIEVGFPKRIVELNELLATDMFANRKFSSVHSELNIPCPEFIPFIKKENDHDDIPAAKRPRTVDVDISGTKVMGLSSGPVPCNEPLCEMIKVVKPIIRELVEDCKFFYIFFVLDKTKV